MTFTIGKHKMRNGEEVTIEEVANNGILVGHRIHYPEKSETWWPDGRFMSNRESPYDLLPPSPPKLEPIVDWRPLAADAIADAVRTEAIEHFTSMAKAKVIPRAQIEILADQQRRQMHDLALRVFDTIHKRTTEQVED